MRDKARFLECLKTTPIIQTACQKTGVSRATYYRWRKDSLSFKLKSDFAIKKGTHFINDMAESQLISLIKDKNMTAIIFWLKHHHRNYSENKIYFSNSDQNKMAELFKNIDINGFYQFILDKFSKGEIPKSVAISLPSMINRLYPEGAKTNQQKKYNDAMDEIARYIDECREESRSKAEVMMTQDQSLKKNIS